MAESAAAGPANSKTPDLSQLFLGFLAISLSGFGGVLPWARRMLVEQRGWLSEQEFAAALALCQFLPGPNIVNLSVIVGSRFRGIAGALAAFAGLVGVPLLIMMTCGALYARYGELEALRSTLAGLAAGAAGLLVAMAAKMAAPLLREREIWAIAFALLAFLSVGLLRVPLYWAVLVLAPLSVGYCFWRLR
jgi:chromate transporter